MGVGAPSIRGGALRAIHDHNQETRYRIIIGLRIHESSGIDLYPPTSLHKYNLILVPIILTLVYIYIIISIIIMELRVQLVLLYYSIPMHGQLNELVSDSLGGFNFDGASAFKRPH